MVNRLAAAVSPYLRSHAENPVDWYRWGPEPFEQAARRDVPVFISIGYATCHWCHVMARESFSDPAIGAFLSENFVAIKVDREEHPDVDSSYLAAASAFTENLGWPLSVFATPSGLTFYAGTYFPPQPARGSASFRQVLDAILDAWNNRRDEVLGNAAAVGRALESQSARPASALLGAGDFDAIVRELVAYEDTEYGGFGSGPKFPVAPVLLALLDRESAGDAAAGALARRALDAMAASELRDRHEGGFFRYAVRRDWTEPHYERMLYDNAQLLSAYARIGRVDVAVGIADFMLQRLLIGSAFASAQDSESTIDGVRVEGGYYALDAAARASQTPPPLDAKVLTGWNGFAIEALATAGSLLDRSDWISTARHVADWLLATHRAVHGTLVRASLDGQASDAAATLEDYGSFAAALVTLSTVTGEAKYAIAAQELVEACMAETAEGEHPGAVPFSVPGGADKTLASHGLAIAVDPSEGAYPSGLSSMALAAHRLFLLTADARYQARAAGAMKLFAEQARSRPLAFGAALSVMSALAESVSQLVVVTDAVEGSMASVALHWYRSGGISAVVTPAQAEAFAAAGFELFEGRAMRGVPTAYLCRDFICQLPETDPEALLAALSEP